MSELPSGDDPVTLLDMLAHLHYGRRFEDSDRNYKIRDRIMAIVTEHAKLVADRDAIDTIDEWLGLGGYDREVHLIPMPAHDGKPCRLKIFDASLNATKMVSGESWQDVRAQLATLLKAL